MEDPKIELNDNPVIKYEITVRVAGAPEPLIPKEGVAQFEVANERCVPLKPLSGARVMPLKRIPIRFLPSGPNEYKGTVYLDQIKDDDYFGQGVCHWSIVVASAHFSVGKTTLIPGIFRTDLLAKKTAITYFPFKALERTDHERILSGVASPPDLPDPSQVFSISVGAREVGQ